MSDRDDEPLFAAGPRGGTIAHRSRAGKNPGVVFLGGFQSDMTGTKAAALDEYCARRGRAYLRFDYQGHGDSSGAFEDGCIGDWADDAAFALETLTKGPQVLVGSSMGGWIMLLLARRMPGRIAAMAGIAAAPDFTQGLAPGDLSGAVTKKLIEDGRRHFILNAPFNLHCPLRLLQGGLDEDVRPETANRIADVCGPGADVNVRLIEDGGHRLSRAQDLALLSATLDELFAVTD
ncbi:MAG: alpha/beta hydrolase [Rhodospirillales bacterium]